MEFGSPWSETLKIMTWAGVALILGVTQLIVIKRKWWVKVSALVVGGGFLVASWGGAPSGYRVDGGGVTVERPFGNVRVERGAITGVRMFEDADEEGLFQSGGVGNLFGYHGTYNNKRLGEHQWYVTNMSLRVVVETKTGAIVLSPDRPSEFIAALKRGQ